MINLFRKKRAKSALQFFSSGFHGDQYLLKLIDHIFSEEKAEIFIETGTNVGSTIAYVATQYPQVQCLSCEPDKTAYREAVKNTAKLSNTTIHNTSSQEFINLIRVKHPSIVDKKALFWLDAHGYGFEWPLKDELKFVMENFKTGFILIDDFKVPGLDCFSYDIYQEHICSFEYIEDAIGCRDYSLFYPTYREKTSPHHPLVGWGMITIGVDFSIPSELIDKMRIR